MSDGISDMNKEMELKLREELKKEKVKVEEDREKLKEKLENIIKEQQERIEALEKSKEDRNGLILYFVNGYLKYPNDVSYKRLITMLEADYMKLSLQAEKNRQAEKK